jgi:hypothetical protein
MSFASRELSVLAYANGFTLWHYRTADSPDCLLAPGGSYFAAADELLRPGDQIIVTHLGDVGVTGASLVVAAIRPGFGVEICEAAGRPVSRPDKPMGIEPDGQAVGQKCEAAAETPLAAAC